MTKVLLGIAFVIVAAIRKKTPNQMERYYQLMYFVCRSRLLSARHAIFDRY